jgi:amino acid transporter
MLLAKTGAGGADRLHRMDASWSFAGEESDVDPIVKILINVFASVACLTLIAMVLVILRRTRRGEKASTDEDWRLLFGKPKAEVLTAHYGMRLGFAFVLCLVLGLVEYLVLFPQGFGWYGVGVVVTTFVIMLLTAKVLR